jgi:hypothetical protein
VARYELYLRGLQPTAIAVTGTDISLITETSARAAVLDPIKRME